MAAHSVFGFLVLLCYFPLLLPAADEQGNHEICPKSFPFPCGYLWEIHFPFTNTTRPECGLPIRGCDNEYAVKEVQLKYQSWYKIHSIHQDKNPSISIYYSDSGNLSSSRNDSAYNDNTSGTIFPPDIMSFHILNNITFYRCIPSFNADKPPIKSCGEYDICSSEHDDSKLPNFPDPCSLSELGQLPNYTEPRTFFTSFLEIEVNLSKSCQECYFAEGSRCVIDREKNQCVDLIAGKEHNGWDSKKVMIIAASVVGVAMLMVLACCFMTKIFPREYLLFLKKENPTCQIIEAYLKEHGPLPTVRYSYLEVKKMTNSFRNKIGQGGYGSVYKGKLHDGCFVAAKVLSESKGNGEEFINEVASISRTSHVNIVTLKGFCLEGSKRALIYEFMPNGSLEKFIYEEKNPSNANRQFDCKMLYGIAVGVARGLEYLHRGCNTRILHFDIKPHNILLDEDFCPKISDFGLAKICPRRESIVSLFGVRGTAGYIAPELFLRNFGGVSYKSDVYSYGMMVLEMVGARKNINVQVDCSSEIYFPHWIYKRLELNEELVLWCIKNESDKEMVRKMTIVSLWCIQTNPSNRPAMSKVVEMLEGSHEVLQIPPKPFLESPSRSPAHFSCDTCETL